jgi:outer membrane protein assembly factor BamB
MRHLSALLVCSVAATAALAAEDWPAWRGPASTGASAEKNLPLRWSDTENLAWRSPIRGLGVSSPVVTGDLVIVTSQIGAGIRRQGRDHPTLVQGEDPVAAGERPLGAGAGAQQDDGKVSFVVTVLDRASGKKVWDYELPAQGTLPEVHQKHNLASASPTTDGQHVFAVFGTGQLVALDMKGQLAWQTNLGAEYSPFHINWGHGSSPVVHKGTLYVLAYHEPASYLLALDARTGKRRWKADRGKGVLSYSTPTVIDAPTGTEIVVNSSEGVDGFDASSGERLWHFKEASRFPIPVAFQNGDIIYLSRGYRSGPYMAIKKGGRGDIAATNVAWRVGTGAPYISSLVLYDGLLYMTGDVGVVTAIDAATGQRVWQERTGGIFTASPVAGDGKIYAISETGEVIVIKAGRTFEELARNKLSNVRLIASPAISGGRIFLRSDDQVIAIGK